MRYKPFESIFRACTHKGKIMGNVQKLSESLSKLKPLLGDIKGFPVLVIGDVGVDEYILGKAHRLSPEAPVPVVNVERSEARLGLAANVAQNLQSLGAKAYLLGVVGADAQGEKIKNLLDSQGLDSSHLVADSSRCSIRKVRVMAGRHNVVRMDYESQADMSEAVEAKVLETLSRLPSLKAVILEDYGKGLLTPSLCEKVMAFAKSQGVPVLTDPCPRASLQNYKGSYMLTPNTKEAHELLLDKLKGLSFEQLGQKLLSSGVSESVVLTQGSEGMSFFSPKENFHLPTYARDVFDVTGAGDTVIAALAIGVAAGWDVKLSCLFANLAAGIVVGKVGSAACELSDVAKLIEEKLER